MCFQQFPSIFINQCPSNTYLLLQGFLRWLTWVSLSQIPTADMVSLISPDSIENIQYAPISPNGARSHKKSFVSFRNLKEKNMKQLCMENAPPARWHATGADPGKPAFNPILDCHCSPQRSHLRLKAVGIPEIHFMMRSSV